MVEDTINIDLSIMVPIPFDPLRNKDREKVGWLRYKYLYGRWYSFLQNLEPFPELKEEQVR
jgi:hypothetical protein